MLGSKEAHVLGSGGAGRLIEDPSRWHEVLVPEHGTFRLTPHAETAR